MNEKYITESIQQLLGLTLTKCWVEKNISGDVDEIYFLTNENKCFKMYHQQESCESVSIESIVGDLSDLVGSPILVAEESSNSIEGDDFSNTWTFYKLATIKGYVDIRWWGESNGYYSERVSVEQIKWEED